MTVPHCGPLHGRRTDRLATSPRGRTVRPARRRFERRAADHRRSATLQETAAGAQAARRSRRSEKAARAHRLLQYVRDAACGRFARRARADADTVAETMSRGLSPLLDWTASDSPDPMALPAPEPTTRAGYTTSSSRAAFPVSGLSRLEGDRRPFATTWTRWSTGTPRTSSGYGGRTRCGA